MHSICLPPNMINNCKKDRQENPVMKPGLVRVYKQHTNGVDCVDQQLNHVHILLKHYKWYQKQFNCTLNACWMRVRYTKNNVIETSNFWVICTMSSSHLYLWDQKSQISACLICKEKVEYKRLLFEGNKCLFLFSFRTWIPYRKISQRIRYKIGLFYFITFEYFITYEFFGCTCNKILSLS